MTLNDVTALMLRYFTEFDSFGGRLRQSGCNVCRISASTFDQNWPTLQRGLSAIPELLGG